MGDLNIQQQPLPENTINNQGKQELGNLRELKVGEGNKVFFSDRDGSRWGHIQFASANAWIKMDGTAQFKTASGQVLLSSAAIDGNFVNVINTALNTASQTILGGFTFQETDYQGAFKCGNPTWSETTGLITGGSGVVINARGILGANAGVATFTLDATTGNATFAGTLVAAAGTLGSITAGTISGVSISGSTISGGTVQTNSLLTGLNVRLTGANSLEFLVDNVQKGYIAMSGGTMLIKGNTSVLISADGTGDSIGIASGTGGSSFISNGDTIITGSDMLFNARNYVTINYNSNGGSDIFTISNEGTAVFQMNDSNDASFARDVFAVRDIRCGGTFKSSDGSSGGNYTSYGFVTDPWTPKWREITVKDGLITNISAELT